MFQIDITARHATQRLPEAPSISAFRLFSLSRTPLFPQTLTHPVQPARRGAMTRGRVAFSSAKRVLAAGLLLSLFAGAQSVAQETPEEVKAPELTPLQIAQQVTEPLNKVKGACVSVTCKLPDREGRRANSIGSGTVISPDGYVLTAAHVINFDHADEFRVIFEDGREFEATLLGYNNSSDTGLLKIRDAGQEFAFAEPAGQAPPIGSFCFAYSRPGKLQDMAHFQLRIGRIKGRMIEEHKTDILQVGYRVQFGDSGGGLFDMDGRLIGINSQSTGREFANVTAVDTVRSELDRLKAGERWGVSRMDDPENRVIRGVAISNPEAKKRYVDTAERQLADKYRPMWEAYKKAKATGNAFNPLAGLTQSDIIILKDSELSYGLDDPALIAKLPELPEKAVRPCEVLSGNKQVTYGFPVFPGHLVVKRSELPGTGRLEAKVSNQMHKVKLVGEDEEWDLALLEVSGVKTLRVPEWPEKELPAEAGLPVLSQDSEGRLSWGILTNTAEPILKAGGPPPSLDREIYSRYSGPYPSAVRHTIPLDAKDAGTPVYNFDGTLIGLHMARTGAAFGIVIRARDITRSAEAMLERSADFQSSEDELSPLKIVNRIKQSVEKVGAACVSINYKVAVPDRKAVGHGTASGTVISADGYVLSAAHVMSLENAKDFMVTFEDGRKFEATLLGFNKTGDTGLLKINDTGQEFPFVKPALKASPNGSACFAYARPASMRKSAPFQLRIGRIKGRTVKPEKTDILHVDLDGQSGDSGAGIFDLDGNLIGIVSVSCGPGLLEVTAIDIAQNDLPRLKVGERWGDQAENEALTPPKSVTTSDKEVIGRITDTLKKQLADQYRPVMDRFMIARAAGKPVTPEQILSHVDLRILLQGEVHYGLDDPRLVEQLPKLPEGSARPYAILIDGKLVTLGYPVSTRHLVVKRSEVASSEKLMALVNRKPEEIKLVGGDEKWDLALYEVTGEAILNEPAWPKEPPTAEPGMPVLSQDRGGRLSWGIITDKAHPIEKPEKLDPWLQPDEFSKHRAPYPPVARHSIPLFARDAGSPVYTFEGDLIGLHMGRIGTAFGIVMPIQDVRDAAAAILENAADEEEPARVE